MRWIRSKAHALNTPLWRGFAGGIAVVIGLALCLWPSLADLAAEPSSELLRTAAAIGGTFLIAYAIELSALVRSLGLKGPSQENFVGGIIGAGACGLVATVVCLALGERVASTQWTAADEFAFAFAAASLLLLGLAIAILPLLAYEWLRKDHLDPRDD